MNQLISYGSQCRSRFTFGATDGYPDVNPVTEVWAIYPRSSSAIDFNYYKKDHHLRFLKLAPGDNYEPLELQLEEVIQGFISRYERFCHKLSIVNIGRLLCVKAKESYTHYSAE